MRLIDADALIPMMKYATTDNEIGVFPIKIGFNAIVKVINDSPTIEPQQWIPVTERLPEVDENVLVSYHFHGESEFFPSHDGVTISYWTGVKNHNIPYFGDLGDASTVLAWMPLPTPWKGEEDVQESD